MSSVFPDKIDNIPKFLDITENDSILLKDFRTHIANNDFYQAKQAFNSIENGSQKIISANKMNKIKDCIIALENFYKTDIARYTDKKQSEWQGIIDRFYFKGEYSSQTIYDINNIVEFREEGQNYLYIKINNEQSAGLPPNDSRYWRKLTIEGLQGTTEAGTTAFMFTWKSSQSYMVNNIVSYNNKWWICTKQNSNQEPREGSSYWKLIMESMQAIYPVQKEMPPNQEINELWFEVL